MNRTRRGPSGECRRDLSPVLNRRGNHGGPRSPVFLYPSGQQEIPSTFDGRALSCLSLPWSSVSPPPGGLELLVFLSAGGPGHIVGDPFCAPRPQLSPFFPSCALCLLLVMSAFIPGFPSRCIEAPFIPVVSSSACALSWLPRSPPCSVLFSRQDCPGSISGLPLFSWSFSQSLPRVLPVLFPPLSVPFFQAPLLGTVGPGEQVPHSLNSTLVPGHVCCPRRMKMKMK